VLTDLYDRLSDHGQTRVVWCYVTGLDCTFALYPVVNHICRRHERVLHCSTQMKAGQESDLSQSKCAAAMLAA
jgi:hypothetical protein